MSITICPAMRGRFGDWTYWYTTMRVGEVLANIDQPSASVMDSLELGEHIQRKLVESRINPMVEYLRRPERFFGPIVVGVGNEEPEFTPILMDFGGLPGQRDIGFGTLNFSGNQSFQVLDGQHRLAALRRASETDTDLLTDTLGVVIVPLGIGSDNLQKARRLFTHCRRSAIMGHF